MSYIRSLSNPEGLYITGTFIRGHAYVDVMGRAQVCIPLRVFHEACTRWNRCSCEENGVAVRGLTIRERYLNPKTGKPCRHLSLKELASGKKHQGEYQIEINYKGTRFWCWRVTWDCILRGVLSEISDAKRHRPWWRDRKMV